MPESKKRKKSVYTPPPPVGGAKVNKGPSPVWLAPLMLALFLIGVAWLVVFYIAGPEMWVVGKYGNKNLLFGFGFIIAGFGIATQWR